MMNLIPPPARLIVSTEYWVRAVSIWLVWLIAAVLVTLALSIPVYVLVSTLNLSLSDQSDQMKQRQVDYETSEDSIKKANLLADYLSKPDTQVPFSIIYTALQSLAGQDVYLNQVSFSTDKKDQLIIKVAGQASTRTALSTFARDLEDHEYFKEAKLPISNLAKDVDVPFAIDVVYETKK